MGAGGIGCGASIAKILLFVFNVVFFLAGAGLMGVGIWIRVDPRSAEFAKILAPNAGAGDPVLQVAAVVVAGIGGFILLVGFLGCCGACCENTCMLAMYATIVIILAIVQIVAGILAAVFSRRVQDTIGNAMDQGMDKYKTSEALRKAWDSMQVWLACCGRKNYQDWNSTKRSNVGRTGWPNGWNQTYPPSCCTMKVKDANKINDNNMENSAACRSGAGGFNRGGCEQSLIDWFKRNAFIIMGVAFGVVGIQFLVAAMACCLRRALNEEEKSTIA